MGKLAAMWALNPDLKLWGKRRLCRVGAWLGSFLLLAGAAGAEQVKPLVDLPTEWVFQPTYSDEFEGVAVDAGKWRGDVKPWGSWTWDTSLVRVQGGRLQLGMAYESHVRDGRNLYYRAGILQSRGEPRRQGYFEARIRAAPRFPGVATGFWLFRNTPEYWTEIDIVEMMQLKLDKRVIHHSLYVMRGAFAPAVPVRENRSARVDWDPSAAFHVYSCLWTEQEIRFFVDGRLLSVEPNVYWHRPMDVVLSLGLRGPLDKVAITSGFPTWAAVDYLRVWGPKAQ